MTDKTEGDPKAGKFQTGRYLAENLNRLYSYKHQIELALESKPRSVLVVGKGDGLVPRTIRAGGAAVLNLDIDRSLVPDLVGSVEAIPLAEASVDVSLCCQVLEHLPFSSLDNALRELFRVTRNRLVLSLPDVRRLISWRVKIVKRGFNGQISLPRWPGKEYGTKGLERIGHHWEMGYKGYEFGKVAGSLRRAGWKVDRNFRVYDWPWHTFFYCSR